jgi:hypothetical protein
MNFHRTDVNRNISASVSVELACLACDEPHSFRESILAGIPIVIVLSDQAFPPILPAKNKRCVVVVRVEDGLLSEIENSFVDLFADFCSPTGRLPVGSVVLLGSMSHLGARGLDSYAGDIVGCMSSVGAKVGHGVEVVPLCPVPIGGLGRGGLIRDIFDHDSWLHCSTTGAIDLLAGARKVFWEIIGSTTGVPLVPQPERMLFIPASIRNPRRRSFRSVGTKNPLPAYLPPISPENEKKGWSLP